MHANLETLSWMDNITRYADFSCPVFSPTPLFILFLILIDSFFYAEQMQSRN